MALVDFVPPEELDGDARELLESFERDQDKQSLFMRAMANNPAMLEARTAYFQAIAEGGTIDRELKELVYVVVSGVNDCEYCATSHGENMVDVFGLDSSLPDAVATGDFSDLTDRQRAVAALARQGASDPKRVTREHLDALADVGFDDAAVVELVVSVAMAVAANTFVDTLSIHPADADREL